MDVFFLHCKERMTMNSIFDHIQPNLDILFVGFNPSIRSGETGHHFANPTNRFWTILHKAGLTDRKYHPEEDHSLLQLGYGLTNIVERATKAADEITKEEYAEGREILKKKSLHTRLKSFVLLEKVSISSTVDASK